MLKRYAYAWITIGFFLISLVLHWYFGWQAYVADAAEHGQSAEFSGFSVEALRDTFENWQSEFLQLLWQVVGLAYFLYVGSPASKENDDRAEAKLDAILQIVGGKDGERMIEQLDREFVRHGGHAKPHGRPANTPLATE
ncbi:DUF6766 family protein [Sphingomonas mesophila]|uniref:DUF6766 family protein n=1 Tax=Sphingomonas mesophila TaxID=2303576 RepID=UPI001F0867D9|nr:DUF6766 family protein [Sphingomonas mesophila]